MRWLWLAVLCLALPSCRYEGALSDTYTPTAPPDGQSKLGASVALIADGSFEQAKLTGGLPAYSFTVLVGPALEQALLKQLQTSFISVKSIRRPEDDGAVDLYAVPELAWGVMPGAPVGRSYRLLLRVVLVARGTRQVVGDYRENTVATFELPAEAKAAGAATALSLFALAPVTEKIKSDAVGDSAQAAMRQAIDTVVGKFGDDLNHDQRLAFLVQLGPLQDTAPPAVAGSTSPYEKFLDGVVVVRNGSSLGSGFFVSRDGKIITCRHVVGDATTLEITDRRGRTLSGQVIGVSADRDLALIQVSATPAMVLELASDVGASVGHDVIAVGTPEGLSWTLSKGIVSAIRGVKVVRVLQTDAAIAPGSSGGPLIDVASHQVVGVTSFGNGAGINFAIAADEVRKAFALELPVLARQSR